MLATFYVAYKLLPWLLRYLCLNPQHVLLNGEGKPSWLQLLCAK